MFRKALLIACAMMPAAALASDIKAKMPDTAFSGKIKPDILGLSLEDDAAKAKGAIEAHFKDRQGVKPAIGQQTFGATRTSYTPSLTFDQPATAKDGGETIAMMFSSPASANRAFLISRTLTFAAAAQPLKSELIKQVMDKYGEPTLIGSQNVYYFYRGGKIVSVKQKYKADTALDALDKPLNAKAAVALNNAKGQGSCVAAVKHVGALDKTLKGLLAEAKDANCDAALTITLAPGGSPERTGKAEFMMVDFKRITSAAAIDDDAAKSGPSAAPSGSAPKL